MYDEAATAIPVDEDHFWAMVEQNFEFARHVLEDYPLQSKQEALEERTPAFLVLAYRGTSDEMDQRDFYYRLGNELLPQVEALITRRDLSIEFVQQWGKLMFCHGMLATYIFDDADPLAVQRAAKRSGEARASDLHRRWLARVFSIPEFARLKREAADHDVGELLRSLQTDAAIRSRYPDGWFEKILTKSGELRSTFQGKNFPRGDFDALCAQEGDDLPPLPKFPD
ncbi:hypothetical protein ACFSX5_10570 [Devosia albogilva]|uniref:DUF4240 domain-containing protein n=1 Tax=Devosia albogilva TaxID=429726 RepID=A0ABW5QLM6_9HYPH